MGLATMKSLLRKSLGVMGKEKIEFYYGSGYLPQSSRTLKVPLGTVEVVVTDYKNRKWKITT